MVRFTGGLLLFSAFACAAPPPTDRHTAGSQQVVIPKSKDDSAGLRKLQGRFLHITDVHPDPFYEVHSSSDSDHACHSGSGESGYYGAESTDCDSPFSLANATFDWIREHLKDEIDFVIWTGDSARHDNDEDFPRTEKQVLDLNEYLVQLFVDVFGKNDTIDDPDPTNEFVVPIVPTFGNNDILPHNIFTPGPNRWTSKYASVWRKFVPEEQRHSFARGGWFFTEVIPNKLAVFSLNTLYFFDSNSAVDGCDAKSEPGYEHMEWLRIQLQFLRDRGMKAIMTGHVPPARTKSKQSWDETCWQKWTLWMRQYRDVVVGNVFGHMNIDHIIFQDVKQLKYDFKIKGIDTQNFDEDHQRRRERTSNDDFAAQAKSTYLNELRDEWADLPTPPRGLSYHKLDDGDDEELDHVMRKKKKSKKQKKREKFLKDIGGKWAERFSVDLVSPSVVPNFYPTLRVVEYNITGLENEHPATYPIGRHISKFEDEQKWADWGVDDLFYDLDENAEEDEYEEILRESELDAAKKPKDKRKKKKKKKPPFKVPKPPGKIAPPGPAYSPQTFTFTGFTQYFANLTRINNEVKDDALALINGDEPLKIEKQDKDKDTVLLKKFKYEVEYNTQNDTVYKMDDLTVRSWLGLAERMGRDALGKSENHWFEWSENEEHESEGEGEGEGEGESNSADEDMDSSEKKADKMKKGSLSKNKMWKMFVKRAFVMTKPDQELEDEFG